MKRIQIKYEISREKKSKCCFSGKKAVLIVAKWSTKNYKFNTKLNQIEIENESNKKIIRYLPISI